ncbi:MAG: glycine cleavage system protein GcvH [Candidatus Izemoplasmatales bacterium]|jgi:glycine cleavage system H protein|nr:glycine cleavage system protein GcvH [bacterium]MDZ4195857.1 glycine cleavage system protein GcvH [Candidatus Izemoplasmatales bacterium]
MSNVKSGLLYSKSHEWVQVVGDVATIGISDFAQAELGNVVFVDLPEVGASLHKEKEFGAVESVKAASDLISPVSGQVLEVNAGLVGEPELLNQDPYTHWLLKVKLSNIDELSKLLDAKSYEAFIK